MENEIKGGDSREVEARKKHESAVGNFRIAEEYTYKFIMDMKDIRDDRYYKELGYSNFNDYCKEAWDVDKWFINERIKIADEFGSEKAVVHTTTFGHTKSLLLARMNGEQREQALKEGVPTEKGTKSYEEATQKEINEWRRRLEEERKAREQAEANAEQYRRSSEIAYKQLEEAEDKEPEIRYETKTEYVEVVDEDAERRLMEYEERFGDLQNYDDSVTATHRQDMIVAVMSLSKGIREFIKRYDYMTRYRDVIANLDPESIDQYNEAVKALKDVAQGFAYAGSGTDIIDADYEEFTEKGA